jgi:putative ABC transport system ATP-binding protein
MNKIIELKHVYKGYPQAAGSQTVLHDINLEIFAGEFVAIVGPSGNGKSTLLNSEQLSAWRGVNLGIVFQFFQLLPALSLLQNIVLPMDFVGKLSKRERHERALHLLELVGLADAADRLPSQVSGGQQQRVAIARALANDPPLIVADEPTGNLDTATADAVFDLFAHLRDQGKTLVMVTHNENLADAASRKLEIRSGRIHADTQMVAGL